MKSPVPLKKYLTLNFIAMAVLPVLTIAFLVWFFILPGIKHRAGIQHRALADSVAGKISTYLKGGERQLSALAGYLQDRQCTIDKEIITLLDAQCGKGEFFETLFIVGREEKTIQAVGLPESRRSRRDDFTGLDFSGQRFMDTVKKDSRIVWSEAFLSTISNREAVALLVPLKDVFIIGEITLDKLSRYISNLSEESDFFTMLLDGNGMIVADSQNLHMGEVLSNDFPAVKKLTGHRPDTQMFFKWDGVDMLGTIAGLEKLDWKVLVAQPTARAFELLR